MIYRVILTLSALAVAVHADSVTTISQNPVCYSFETTIPFQAFSTFVDVDGNSAPSAGDLSIARFRPTIVRPINTGSFRIRFIEIQGICILTSSSTSAPTCSYEIDLDFCTSSTCTTSFTGKVFGEGTGPDPIAITGGVRDFTGAFGQIVTNGSFQASGTTLSFDADQIQVCFYQNFPSPPILTQVTAQTGGNSNSAGQFTATCGSQSCTVVGNRAPNPTSCTIFCEVGDTIQINCQANNSRRDIDDFEFVSGVSQSCSGGGQSASCSAVVGLLPITARCAYTD